MVNLYIIFGYDHLYLEITIDWKSANFYTPRITNGEIRMVKYFYLVITIMNAVLWRGRDGVFALSRMLI